MGRKPAITYVEILARAMSSIEFEIEDLRRKCDMLPADQREKMFSVATAELRTKLSALETLYSIETGKSR